MIFVKTDFQHSTLTKRNAKWCTSDYKKMIPDEKFVMQTGLNSKGDVK